MRTSTLVIIGLSGILTWQGCDSDEAPAPVDCTENPVQLNVLAVGNASCNQTDGSIDVIATGGAGSYQYRLGSGTAQTGSTFGNVGAGAYEITVEDANKCSATVEVTVNNDDGLNISFETSAAGCKTDDGSISVMATDGAEPYQYKLGSGSFSENNAFTDLAVGEYDLVVTDASGCTVTQKVKVSSGVSFTASISPIISSKCAINTCHNGTQFPDFRVFQNVQGSAAQIKTLTGNGTMPQEGSLTQAEKDMIACWVDDGALNN